MFFVKSGGKEIMIGLGDKVEINKQFCKKRQNFEIEVLKLN